MATVLLGAVRSQIDARPHLQVRFYRAAYLLLSLLSLAT